MGTFETNDDVTMTDRYYLEDNLNNFEYLQEKEENSDASNAEKSDMETFNINGYNKEVTLTRSNAYDENESPEYSYDGLNHMDEDAAVDEQEFERSEVVDSNVALHSADAAGLTAKLSAKNFNLNVSSSCTRCPSLILISTFTLVLYHVSKFWSIYITLNATGCDM